MSRLRRRILAAPRLGFWLVFLLGAAAGGCQGGASNAPQIEPFVCADAPLVPREMHDALIGEEHGEVFDTDVLYLDPEARKSRVVEVHGGQLETAAGEPYDTRGVAAIFVLSPEGVLYSSNEAQKGLFHHSSFLAAGPVAGAGEILVDDGQLRIYSDRSGHYTPTRLHTGQTLCWLAGHGVDMSQVEFRSYVGGAHSAQLEILVPEPAQ